MARQINDIRLVFRDESDEILEGDFNFDTDVQDLESLVGLESAIIVSLFTDRRANDDDELPDSSSTDRRGWWGDLTSGFTDDQVGSKLWLLERAKTTADIVPRAKKYTEEALQWLIDDGIVASIEVEVERQENSGNDRLAIKVTVYRLYGNKQAEEFDFEWSVQESRMNSS